MIIRIVRMTLQHVTRSVWHTLAVVLVMALTFFLGGVYLFVARTADDVLHYYETRPSVIAFFEDRATTTEILDLKQVIESRGGIQSISYVSKEEALEIYKQLNKDEPELLEFITPEDLPASLEVMATNIDELYRVADELKSNKLVSSVIFQKDILENIKRVAYGIRVVGATLFIILLSISVLIMLITIGTNIASRKEEIEIMRLVGASSWYIRWPFILEGIVYGLSAAAITVGAIGLIVPKLLPYVSQFFWGIEITSFSRAFLLEVFGYEAAFGILIGVFGSVVATWRYLRN